MARTVAKAARRRYRILEHTADVGIEAWGESAAEAFAAAAEAMYSLIARRRRVRERLEMEVAARGRDLEGLLVNWLLELLYITEVEDLVFRRFQVHELSDTALRASAFGEALDLERHPTGMVVKGVTRHRLEVGRFERGYRVRAILDI